MIQFNLLPDVKLEFMRAERNKRLVTTVATLVTVVSLVLLIILTMVVMVFQKKYMSDMSSDIAKYSADLKATPDLNKILTVQNQINSLSALHQAKPDPRRVLPYIEEITPSEVSIASTTIDFSTNTMSINGAANSLAFVNKFVDTLKFTKFVHDGQSSDAFSGVVLASFGRADKGASYTLNLTFDPAIFANTTKGDLKVPSQITTRSETEKPAALFEAVTGNKD